MLVPLRMVEWDYCTVNFTTAMPDINYSISINSSISGLQHLIILIRLQVNTGSGAMKLLQQQHPVVCL
jgi:hypothetical protein